MQIKNKTLLNCHTFKHSVWIRSNQRAQLLFSRKILLFQCRNLEESSPKTVPFCHCHWKLCIRLGLRSMEHKNAI